MKTLKSLTLATILLGSSQANATECLAPSATMGVRSSYRPDFGIKVAKNTLLELGLSGNCGKFNFFNWAGYETEKKLLNEYDLGANVSFGVGKTSMNAGVEYWEFSHGKDGSTTLATLSGSRDFGKTNLKLKLSQALDGIGKPDDSNGRFYVLGLSRMVDVSRVFNLETAGQIYLRSALSDGFFGVNKKPIDNVAGANLFLKKGSQAMTIFVEYHSGNKLPGFEKGFVTGVSYSISPQTSK